VSPTNEPEKKGQKNMRPCLCAILVAVFTACGPGSSPSDPGHLQDMFPTDRRMLDSSELPDVQCPFTQRCAWRGADSPCQSDRDCTPLGMQCIEISPHGKRCDPRTVTTILDPDGGAIECEPDTVSNACSGKYCRCYQDACGTFSACSIAPR
jgi:hypothetical protein